jgi:hypothetical protein
MTENEKRLRGWLTTYQQHGTLTALARGYLDGVIAEHRVALSAARAEALEEAAMEADAHGVHVTARNIRHLKTSPRSASIPVERVREEARRLITTHLTGEAEVRAVATLADSLGANVDDLVPHEWIGAIGVPLDGAGGEETKAERLLREEREASVEAVRAAAHEESRR